MKSLLKQILSFVVVSGTGWIVDFCIYCFLTYIYKFKVAYANFLSGIPSLTFVFLVSTKKIFTYKEQGLTLKQKYVLYFCYQMLLIICISYIGQVLYEYFETIEWIKQHAVMYDKLKILTKIVITPVTMTVNFGVMKMLSEKI